MKRNLSLDKKKLYTGVEKLGIAVGSTLGPKGRPVLIEDQPGHPKLTKDGVTVAKHLQLSDSEENLGARLVAQAASATVSAAGDGTTTSTVLADAIVNAGRMGEVSVDFLKGVEEGSEEVIKYLENTKKDLTDDDIYNIAHISTNNDKKLGKIIAEAFIQSGSDGIVDARYIPNATETTLEVQAGSYLPAGYAFQHFITNQKQRTCELQEPYILVSNATLNELTQIEHILEKPVNERVPIIIIADTDKNFNEAFVSNVSQGLIKGCIIQPGQSVSSDALRDLAALLGGIYFDNANGNSFDYLSNNYWGRAKEATIGNGFSLFSLDSNDHVKSRVEDLQVLLENAEPGWEDEYRARLMMLNGKYATIKVGAPTQAQALEVKDRVDDAVFAVGSAQKNGYLPGGGVALRDASYALERLFEAEGDTDEFMKGYNFLLDSIEAPYELILDNAGIKNEFLPEDGKGVDASNGEWVDMVERGIIDPAFVTMQAVINATSAAVALLSSKATLLITEDK